MPMTLFARRSAVVTRIMPRPTSPCPSALVLPVPIGAPAGLDRAPWRGYLVRAFVLAGGKPRREETTLAALVRLIKRGDEPAGDADRAILTALVQRDGDSAVTRTCRRWPPSSSCGPSWRQMGKP